MSQKGPCLLPQNGGRKRTFRLVMALVGRFTIEIRQKSRFLSASLIAVCLAGLPAVPPAAQDTPGHVPPPIHAPPATLRITLEEAKQRALSSNKLLHLAALNAEGKVFAVKAAQAD